MATTPRLSKKIPDCGNESRVTLRRPSVVAAAAISDQANAPGRLASDFTGHRLPRSVFTPQAALIARCSRLDVCWGIDGQGRRWSRSIGGRDWRQIGGAALMFSSCREVRDAHHVAVP